ncbi:hypothetical protein, partial [Acetobacter malorum]
PVEPSQKTSEHTTEQAQEQTTQQPQTAPEQPEIGSNTETTQEIKAEASEGMSREEKIAISEFNKEQNEKEKLLKEALANQKKRATEMLEDMQKNKKPELKPTWADILDDREKLLTDIIDKPHPKLKSLTKKETRDFLYKNFKDELDNFYEDRNKLCELRKDIRQLKKNNNWYNVVNKSKLYLKETKEEKDREKLKLLALYLVHLMMHKLGLVKNAPVAFNYMTNEQKKEAKIQFKENKYAKLLFNNADRAKCLDAIAFTKFFEQDDKKLDEWKNRPEVRDAKKALLKLNNIRNVDIMLLDEQGKKELKEAQEELNIEKARKAIKDAEKREDQRYLMDVREPEKTQEKEETIEQSQEQDKEKSNVVQFPKNNNVKKKKSFSYSR